MRQLTRNICFLSALSLCLPALPAVAQRAPHTDTIGAQLVEARHIFHCGDSRVVLAFVERYRIDEDDLLRRQVVDLSSFSVSERTIPPDGGLLLEREFQRFAWIERVTVRCSRFNRRVEVTVRGMLAEAWAALGADGATERPEPVSLRIVVEENGAVTIR